MKNKHIHEILEQDAIYDGKPAFPPGGMLVGLLNYYALGGTRQDMEVLRASGEYPNPKRYRVRLTIEYEEITESGLETDA